MGHILVHKTVDDVINSVGEHPTFLALIFALLAMSFNMVSVSGVYMIQFTGFIPTEDWTCLSPTCLDLQEMATKDGIVNRDFYALTTICDNDMVYDVDYFWNINRTTMAIEFDAVCRQNLMSLLTSLYSIGAWVGIFVGMMTYELFGRRRVALVAAVLFICANVMGIFCHNYWFMVVIRILHGLADMVAYWGAYLWCFEFSPEKYRLYYNTAAMVIWTVGYPVMVCMAYFIDSWNNIYIATTVFSICCYVPLAILPDSPRFLMSVGKIQEAKSVLESYSRLWGVDQLDLRDTILLTSENDTEKEGTSIKQMLKGYLEHKAMLFETIITIFMWFNCSLLYYGLNYGWWGFGDTPYANYLYAGLGETIAYCSIIPITVLMGRRLAMSISLFAACACFSLGMINWEWTHVWNLERLMSLTACALISLALGLFWLYSSELAPTSHRGFSGGIGGLISPLAMFLGAFESTVITSSRVKLGINIFAAGSAGILTLLLPETRALPIPECPADVTKRRQKQNLPFFGGKLNLESNSLPSALKSFLCD